MILGAISDSVLGKLAEVPLRPAIDLLEKYLSDRRSFNHARERLRAKYEDLVKPSNYEFIVENFYITKQDFVDYFQSSEARTANGLDGYLKGRLVDRSSLWEHNRPNEDIYRDMIEEFYEAYFRYYISRDPQLCGLQTNDVSKEILKTVSEIQGLILSIQQGQGTLNRKELFADVLLALKVANIPYSIVEQTPDHIDFTLIDPTSLLPANLYVCLRQDRVNNSDIDEVKARASSEGSFTHLIVVGSNDKNAIVAYAKRRQVQLISPDAFVSLLTHPSGTRPFVIGRLGSNGLEQTLRVDQTYIQPDVVVATPGDDMENRYFNDRINSDSLIDNFLSQPGSGVLMVLGNYGAGKSALAAHSLSRLSLDSSAIAPAYVPMRDLSCAEDIVSVTRRCISTLRAAFPDRQRFVTILDGLDEMPNAMDGTERKRNMQAILRAAALGSKLIVMVRVSYFAGLTDFWSFFSVGGESSLWSKLATHLPSASERTNLQVVIIRDFDSAQIQEYVESMYGPEGARDYFESLQVNDLDGTYERLQRNPLYLYLILKTRPWEDQSIECFCDVIEQFINYWLERDVEKGPSRWLLSTIDRREFIGAIAVDLFKSNNYVIDAKSFHDYVLRHFSIVSEDQTAASLVLDLQTTGIFTIVGNSMTFSMRAYADYFVAKRLAWGNSFWDRLPDAYQARMWLGLVETKNCNKWMPDTNDSKAWFAEMDIPEPIDEELVFDSRGILYGAAGSSTERRVNTDGYGWLREIFRKIFTQAEIPPRSTLVPDLADEICDVIVVALRIENRLGLHARASAKLTQAAHKALGLNVKRPSLVAPGQDMPTIHLKRLGRKADASSIMAVMMIAATRGTELEVIFSNCRQKQAMYFLDQIKASPEQEIDGMWVTRFGE